MRKIIFFGVFSSTFIRNILYADKNQIINNITKNSENVKITKRTNYQTIWEWKNIKTFQNGYYILKMMMMYKWGIKHSQKSEDLKTNMYAENK